MKIIIILAATVIGLSVLVWLGKIGVGIFASSGGSALESYVT